MKIIGRNNIKKVVLLIILCTFFTGIRAFSLDKSINLIVNNKEYSIRIPEEWSVKDNGEYTEIIRGDKTLGGFYSSLSTEDLSEYKLDEVSTAMGKIGIYTEGSTSLDNKIYAVFPKNNNSSALFLYTSKETLERDKFMLKMLLINIKAL